MVLTCPKCQTENPSDLEYCRQCSAPLHTQAEISVPETIITGVSQKPIAIDEVISDKYRLIEQLGMGGMGIVYKAEQLEPVKRTVALKIIKLGMDTGSVIARFETEKQALALMDHPNIARVFDAGATDKGRPYFVMELVQGVPINHYCDGHDLTMRERVELFVPVCQAVQHAHQKGVIHRDLKPSNVMVAVEAGKPVPKIIDFGIAKATGRCLTEQTLFTEQGLLIGTPEYMSPEQADMSGQDVDTRTDIYSLGVMLYELLVGVLPFDSKTLREAGYNEIQRIIREEEPLKASTRLSRLGDAGTDIARHRRADPVSLHQQLKGDLDWITMKAMAKDRAHRYASASELVTDIERHLNDEPVLASPPSTAYRVKKYIKRHRTGVIAAALVLAALLAGIAGTTMGFVKARRAERTARDEAQTATRISDFLVRLFEVSDPSEARGNTITAREILDSGAEKIDLELKSEPLVRARLMNTMGEVYYSLGLYKNAETLLDMGLAIRRQSLNAEDPVVAESLNRLGNVFWRKGEYEKAQSLHEEALKIREKAFGPEHRAVAGSLNDLANLFDSMGDYRRAKPLYERAVEIYEKSDGPDNLSLAKALNNLGLLLYEMGDYQGARPLYERSLAIYEQSRGPEHPAVTAPLLNLGLLSRSMGEHDKARSYYERCLKIEEKVFGPEHPHLAETLGNLAILHATTANFEAARPLFERVLSINEKALGPESPRVGSDLTNLGILNAQMGDFKAARPLLERGLAIKEKTLGPDHPRVATNLESLASLLRDMGKPESARPLIERALAIREKALGPDHPDVSDSLTNLANTLVELKDYAKAEPLFERALAIREKARGPEQAGVATILNGLANLLRLTNKPEQARAMLERALAINEKELGGDHPEVADSLMGLAKVLYDTGKYDQARPLLERTLAIREKKLGPDHPYVADTLDYYAGVLRKLSMNTEAQELDNRAKAIRKR